MSKRIRVSIEEGGPPTATCLTSKEKGNPLSLWSYNGKIYASGIGKMYSEHGFPVSCSLDECIKHNWVPSLCATVDDMYMSGMSREKAAKIVSTALCDIMGTCPQSWSEVLDLFRQRYEIK